MQAEVAAVDVGDLRLGDDGGRRRDGDIGVNEELRRAAVDAAVEEDDRAPGRERLLFGEGDFDLGVSGADDRARTGLLRGGGRPRFQPALLAGGQALGVHLDALVEVGDHALERRRMAAVRGADLSVEHCGDRRLPHAGQLGRRDPAVVCEEESPHLDRLRLGEGACREDQRERRSRTASVADQVLLLLIPVSEMSIVPAGGGPSPPRFGV